MSRKYTSALFLQTTRSKGSLLSAFISSLLLPVSVALHIYLEIEIEVSNILVKVVEFSQVSSPRNFSRHISSKGFPTYLLS